MDARQSVNRVYTKPTTSNASGANKKDESDGQREKNKVAAASQTAQEPELKIRTLRQYLLSLPGTKLERIYSYPATCMAIFRDLPEMARLFIMRIAFVEQPVPRALISTWCSQQYRAKVNEVIRIMSALQLWHLHSIHGGLQAWELCSTFKETIKATLFGGGKPWEVSHQQSYDRTKDRDVGYLDNYAMARWRCVLHFLVGSKDKNALTDVEGVSPDAVRILLHAGLMRHDEACGIILTPRGFQFLLLDTQTQVWHFMLEYIDTCEERGLDTAECLSLLFQLSLSTLGRGYSTEKFTPKMLIFLQHLREFGLVFQRKRKEQRFFPTRLATSINNSGGISQNPYQQQAAAPQEEPGTASAATLDLQAQLKGFIIVETNFRIYAHTDSQLHIAVLGLFSQLLYRFPSMLVGVLTRDSLRQAFRVGITAKQIVRFLEQYAHPEMRKNHTQDGSSVIPPTVVDQIHLWENERNRFIFTEGVIYNSFLSQNDYATLSEYAGSIGALIWENARTRTMICSKEGHDEVKRYWKRYSKSHS